MSEELAWHSLDVKDVLLKFNSGVKGISSKEAISRLDIHGYNELIISKTLINL